MGIICRIRRNTVCTYSVIHESRPERHIHKSIETKPWIELRRSFLNYISDPPVRLRRVVQPGGQRQDRPPGEGIRPRGKVGGRARRSRRVSPIWSLLQSVWGKFPPFSHFRDSRRRVGLILEQLARSLEKEAPSDGVGGPDGDDDGSFSDEEDDETAVNMWLIGRTYEKVMLPRRRPPLIFGG